MYFTYAYITLIFRKGFVPRSLWRYYVIQI